MNARDRRAVSAVPMTHMRRLARWLELRAVALTPEYLHMEDGIRSAFIVAMPLLLVTMTGRSDFGWMIFAAFWTCLVEITGEEKTRRALLFGFVVLGSITALATSAIASSGPIAALSAGPALVALTALLPLLWPASLLVATLLGAVAVVAAGYPRPPVEAVMLGLSFLAGGGWAAIVLTFIWRTDRWLPARKAVASIYANLGDMAADLTHNRPAPDNDGHDRPQFHHGRHRRAVRSAIERAHTRLEQFQPEHLSDTDKPMLKKLRAMLSAGDEIFHALIALEHRQQSSREDSRLSVALGMIPALLAAARENLASTTPDGCRFTEAAALLDRIADDLPTGDAGAVGAIAKALLSLCEEVPTPKQAPLPDWRRQDVAHGHDRRVIKTAIRSGIGVACVTLAAHVLSLSYPYWATMAVVVVLQPARHLSWSRALERILGSAVGGVMALALLWMSISSWLLAAIAILVSAVTIALRSVNYTMFVTFLTLLFVLVMTILNRETGIEAARVLDNVIGSLAAILTALLIWPDRAPPISALVTQAVTANQAYLDAVRLGDPAKIALARRKAGLASTAAEIAIHAPDWFLGSRPTNQDIAALMTSRQLAGEAAVAWYAR